MIADMLNNRKLELLITELFIKSRKIYASIVFDTQSYFAVQKKNWIKFYTLFIMKICNKHELQ